MASHAAVHGCRIVVAGDQQESTRFAVGESAAAKHLSAIIDLLDLRKRDTYTLWHKRV